MTQTDADYLEKAGAKRTKSTFRWDNKSIVLFFFFLLMSNIYFLADIRYPNIVHLLISDTDITRFQPIMIYAGVEQRRHIMSHLYCGALLDVYIKH